MQVSARPQPVVQPAGDDPLPAADDDHRPAPPGPGRQRAGRLASTAEETLQPADPHPLQQSTLTLPGIEDIFRVNLELVLN